MNVNQLLEACRYAIAMDRPLLGWGPPGIGKSTVAHYLAAADRMPILDWRLTEYESVDMRGTPRERNGRTYWAAPEELPIINGKGNKVSCIINGEKVEAERGIILLDELPQAKTDVKNVAARLVLERRVGEARIGAGWRFLAMGNRLGDAAGTSPMPTHLNNRFWHVEVEANVTQWITDFAEPAGIDSRIIAYLKYRPQALLVFDPRSKEAAFASPRSWHLLSDLLKALAGRENTMDAALLGEYCAGAVGKAHGLEFAAFLRTLLSLVSIEQILLDPRGARLPTDPSVCYALATALAAHVKRDSIEAAFTYTQRMSKEFAFVFAKKVELLQANLTRTKAWTTFTALNADYV